MNFSDYLIESYSPILYESVDEYKSLLEAVEDIIHLPPTWAVEFSKNEPNNGEYSKTLVRNTVVIDNVIALRRVIKDTITDPVNGFIILSNDIPVFAGIKNKKDTSSYTLMLIAPNSAKALSNSTWTKYNENDGVYFAIQDKYHKKKLTTNKLSDSFEEIVNGFTANYVTGTNTPIETNESLKKFKINIKTIGVVEDEDAASSASSQNGNGNPYETSNKVIKDFTNRYMETIIKNIEDDIKLVPTLHNYQARMETATKQKYKKIDVQKITDHLTEFNDAVIKLQKKYKDADKTQTDWEKKLVDDLIAELTTTA